MAGQNVLVTGASRGLGHDLARALWGRGANVLLVARNDAALRQVQAELLASQAGDQEARILAVDLGRSDAVPRIQDVLVPSWSHVDVLVNNAAILGPIGPAWETDWQEWQSTIRVNLLAPVELCRACVPTMVARRRGKIINLSGGGATGPRPAFSAYATAKAGLVRFSETLAEEVRAANVQVNCVAPGVMRTDLVRAVVEAGPRAAGAREYAQAADILESADVTLQKPIDLCLFLASEASAGITGKLLSAAWDPWESLTDHLDQLSATDVYTLRRIVPRDRGEF